MKDYLVKPVDQEELTEVVTKIEQELTERQHRKEQEQLYSESSIGRWLNDELNEQEFLELMADLELPIQGPFTAIKLLSDAPQLQAITQQLKENHQRLIIAGSSQQNQQITLIFQGDAEQLKRFWLR